MLRKDVVMTGGEVFTLYYTPLTAAEREKANREVGDDSNGFGLHLLVRKATDENGVPLFSIGDIPELKNGIRDEDLQKLMLAVLRNEEGPLDLKSAQV
jgi:hypothetical protein